MTSGIAPETPYDHHKNNYPVVPERVVDACKDERIITIGIETALELIAAGRDEVRLEYHSYGFRGAFIVEVQASAESTREALSELANELAEVVNRLVGHGAELSDDSKALLIRAVEK